jgi:hypothetical protein
VAWVFEPEDNPFTKDPWNTAENMKIFRKNRLPYNCSNFVCQIQFNDWPPEQKAEYYAIRNKKRVLALDQNKSDKKERYGNIKEQRDKIIRTLFGYNENVTKTIKAIQCSQCKDALKKTEIADSFTNEGVGDITGLSRDAIRLIRLGLG